jgi:hypothetical protein
MDVARHLKEILIGVNKIGFISPLIKVPGSMVLAIERSGIADIEMAHELGQIALRGGDQ